MRCIRLVLGETFVNHPLSPTARATRRRILDGAGRVFAAIGIRNATVRDILLEAEVSRRTFYLYFPNTDAVRGELYRELADRMLDAIEKALDSTPDPIAQIGASISAYIDVHIQGGPLVTVLMADSLGPDSPLGPHREAAVQRWIGLLAGAVARTGLPPLEPLLLRGLITGIEGIAIHAKANNLFDAAHRPVLETTMKTLTMQILAAGPMYEQLHKTPR